GRGAGGVGGEEYRFWVARLGGVGGRRPGGVEDASPPRPPEPVSLRRRALPARLSRALARGLSVDPGQRWPSMDALLDALREARLPFRRSTGALTVALILVTIGVWIQH